MSKVAVSREALLEIIEKRIDHILKKNHDYGDSWQTNGPFTPLMRIKEKLIRVETLSDGRQALVLDEKVEDNIGEVFDYALLWLLWKSGQEPKQLSFLEWLRADLGYGKQFSAPISGSVDEDFDDDGSPF